nr:hypothetical protein [Butyrivibrio sp.]
MSKKILALMLSVTMAFSAPITALAADGSSVNVQEESSVLSNGTSTDDSSDADTATASDTDGSNGSNTESTDDANGATTGSTDDANTNATADDTNTDATTDSTDAATDDDSSDATTGSTDAATEDVSSDDAATESTDDASALLSGDADETALLSTNPDVPEDFIYDDLIFTPYANFEALYLSELSADPKAYTVDLSLGNYLYPITGTSMLSEFFGTDITTGIIGDKYIVETVAKSGNSYTPVTGDASPISISFESSAGADDLTFRIAANAPSTPLEGSFFLHIKFDFPDHFKSSSVKELYVPLIKAPQTETLCNTKEEAYAAVRDIIRNRTNNLAYFDDASNRYEYDNYVYDRIYVKSDVFTKGSITMTDVCDFEEERTGMAPYEGDYMFNLLGNRVKRDFYYEGPSFATPEGKTFGNKYASDNTYNVYEVYLPVITTKAEEDTLDAKVSELLSSTFSHLQYDDVSNKDKIRAVYSYIRNNVSGTVSGAGGSDRTYPLYHTAYHALINGNGTCEAFAQLFTRLTRELGVPSRVIMGLDSANHTYNIVDGGDGYWYYIDCSAGIYLTDSKNFKRAEEQERFTTPKFIHNYLDKVKGGSSYNVKSAKVIDSEGNLVYEAFDLEDLCSFVNTASSASGEDLWTIRFDSDWTIELDAGFSFDHPDNITLDLNGNTLTCKNECTFNIGAIKNGTIKVGRKDGWSSYSGNTTFESAFLENVTLQGVTGMDQLKIPPRGHEVRFKNVTVKKMDILINLDRSGSDSSDSAFTVEGNLTIDNCFFYVASQTGHPIIKLAKDAGLVFSGTSTFGGWDYPVPEYDNYQPTGSNSHDYFVGTAIEMIPAEDGRFFTNGDLIITNLGTLKKVTSAKGSTSAAKLEDVIDIAGTQAHKSPSDDTLSLITIGKSLQFAKATYSVSVDGSDAEPSSFVTLAEATAHINSLNNASNEYTITLLDSTGGAEALTLPTKAKKITITGAGSDTTPGPLTLRHSGNVSLSTNLELKDLVLSPVTRGATFNLNGKTLTLSDTTYIDNGDDKTCTGAYSAITGSGKSTLVIADHNRLDISAKVTVANISFVANSGSYRFANVTATTLENAPANTSAYPAVLYIDKLTANKLYLMPGSITRVDSSAVITSLFLGKDIAGNTGDGNILLLRAEQATIAVNTAFTTTNPESTRLALQTFDSNGVPIGTRGGTVLFTTKMKVFPMELIDLQQKEPYDEYTALFRTGNDIIIGKSWLSAWVYDPVSAPYGRSLGDFARWSDTIAAIEADSKPLKKASEYRSYVILLTDNVDIRQKMTFPKKAKSLVIRSTGGKHYTLTHRGDLAPTLPVTFRDITLTVPEGMNVKLSLSANKVTFSASDSANTYSAVSGSAKSSLILEDASSESRPVLSCKGAFSVGTLRSTGHDIESLSGAITVSSAAYIADTAIDAATNVTFKDLHSLDGNNEISFAGTAKGTFKINGNMYANADAKDASATDGDNTSIINSCAVSVRHKFYSSTEYPSGKDIITAAKVPACFFVVEKEEAAPGNPESDPWTVRHTTKKFKKGVRINSESEEAPAAGPVLLRQRNDSGSETYTIGRYANLQAAFNDIKAIASKTAHYVIDIDGTSDYGKADSSLDTANISTPAQAANIVIQSLDPEHTAYLHVKSSLTLGSPLTLKDLAIAGLTDKRGKTIKLGINLSKYRLTLESFSLPALESGEPSDRIGKVSGNGTGKTSVLEITASGVPGAYAPSGLYDSTAAGYTFAAALDLVNIGEVLLKKDGTKVQHLLVSGKATVGKVSIEGGSTVTSFAKV